MKEYNGKKAIYVVEYLFGYIHLKDDLARQENY